MERTPQQPEMTETQALKLQLIRAQRALHTERIMGSQSALRELEREEYELVDEINREAAAKAAASKQAEGGDGAPALKVIGSSGAPAAA